MTYLDHAATTPMRPEARDAMVEQMTRTGNPSSLHGSGRAARRVVEESRESIAAAIGARPGEVVFTSGGTEADNLAVKGLFWARHKADPRRNSVAISSVEHHAVLDSAHWLHRHRDADVIELAVDAHGRLDMPAFDDLLSRVGPDLALVSVMWANNEVGTLQPIADVAAHAQEHGITVHTDAVQAVGHVPVDFAACGVDALTMSSHKLGGPLGVGALVVRREVTLTPVLHGGGQERDIRSGTLDVPAIAGMAAAVVAAVSDLEAEAKREATLRDELVAGVLAAVPDAIYDASVDKLPGNAHFRFRGCEGDALLMLLDAQGIECSTGSACQAGVPQPSHVLLAMGLDERDALSALRFSLGHTTTSEDVAKVIEAIGPAVERAKRAAS